jgi:hypothetical protein
MNKEDQMEKQIEKAIENDIDYAIEMENSENPCCEECEYWDAFALKHSISRTQMDNIRATEIGNLATDCRVYKGIAKETLTNLLERMGLCVDCRHPINSEHHFGKECVNYPEER